MYKRQGIDIAVQLLEYAEELKKSVYLFGAKPQVIEAMKRIMKEKYRHAKLAGACDGYVKNKDKIFEHISQLQPDIVLVALGIPAQEKLIYRHLDSFSKGILVGVGGSFDVMSGTKKRAPKFFIKLNLEWPVSYTHLDVYKRQPPGVSNKLARSSARKTFKTLCAQGM